MDMEDLRNRVHALRGEYLSTMAGVEAWVDLGVAEYFNRGGDDQFHGWLLSKTRTRDKIDLVRLIARQLGVEDDFTRFRIEWEKANDFRNDVAHSHVDLHIPEGIINEGSPPSGRHATSVGGSVFTGITNEEADYLLNNLASIRTTRAGRTATKIEEEALAERLESAEILMNVAFRFWLVVMSRHHEDAAELLRSFDELVPDNLMI